MAQITLSKTLLLSFAALPLTVILPDGVSANAGGEGGCPAGFELVSLDYLEIEGRRQAAILADETGNNDGYVCRRPLGDGIFHTFPTRPDTVYHWMDNAEPRDGK